jgi:hypothetical protein
VRERGTLLGLLRAPRGSGRKGQNDIRRTQVAKTQHGTCTGFCSDFRGRGAAGGPRGAQALAKPVFPPAPFVMLPVTRAEHDLLQQRSVPVLVNHRLQFLRAHPGLSLHLAEGDAKGDRRRRFHGILPAGYPIISEALSVRGRGRELFALMQTHDLEGIVAKHPFRSLRTGHKVAEDQKPRLFPERRPRRSLL